MVKKKTQKYPRLNFFLSNRYLSQASLSTSEWNWSFKHSWRQTCLQCVPNSNYGYLKIVALGTFKNIICKWKKGFGEKVLLYPRGDVGVMCFYLV